MESDKTDSDDIEHVVVLTKREIDSLVYCARQYAGAAPESPTIRDLLAAPVAGPRYLLVARDSNSDGRDTLEIETYATREELVAAVTGYALSYYDDLCAYDRGVAIPDVEDLPEVRAAVEQQREAQRQRDLASGREWRQREYLRLKAEFEPATTSKSEGA